MDRPNTATDWRTNIERLSSLCDKIESSVCSLLRNSDSIDRVNWFDLFKNFDNFGKELFNLRNRRIEELFNSGLSGVEIAKKMGISAQRLNQIKHSLEIEQDDIIPTPSVYTDSDNPVSSPPGLDQQSIAKLKRIAIREFTNRHCPYSNAQVYGLKRTWKNGAYCRSYGGVPKYRKSNLIQVWKEGWDFMDKYLKSRDLESFPY